MATSKKLKMEDIRAHLFISVIGNHVDIVYHDDADNGAGLGAALASAMEEDDKLFGIFSAAFVTVLENRDKKSISKKSNKVPKKTASKPKK